MAKTNPGRIKLRQWKRGLLACFVVSPLAAGEGVGLPDYNPPASAQPEPVAQMAIKQISHGATEPRAGFRCNDDRQLTATTLDMAPQENMAAEAWRDLPRALPNGPAVAKESTREGNKASLSSASHGRLDFPVYINGSSALLKMGKTVTSVNTATDRHGRTVLASRDSDYFRGLQSIQPTDKLLVQTPRTLRHYRVTGTRIVPMGREIASPARKVETLTLAACHPFQPIDGQPLLYIVRAQAIPTSSNLSESPEEVQSSQTPGADTVKF